MVSEYAGGNTWLVLTNINISEYSVNRGCGDVGNTRESAETTTICHTTASSLAEPNSVLDSSKKWLHSHVKYGTGQAEVKVLEDVRMKNSQSADLLALEHDRCTSSREVGRIYQPEESTITAVTH